MKLIIDIPDKLYETCKRLYIEGDARPSESAIANGIKEEIEKPFITECRNAAIEKNLPLYFVYYEDTGIFEVYITETKELFEKRHCTKHLQDHEFKEIVTNYLDLYSECVKR